jgi:hypothetical protein
VCHPLVRKRLEVMRQAARQHPQRYESNRLLSRTSYKQNGVFLYVYKYKSQRLNGPFVARNLKDKICPVLWSGLYAISKGLYVAASNVPQEKCVTLVCLEDVKIAPCK